MRAVPSRHAALVATLAVVMGCAADAELPPVPDDPVPPRDASPLQTALLEYDFIYQGGVYSGSVVATYTNTGSATVYLDRCGRDSEPVFYVVTAAQGSAPADVEGPISICTGVPPIAVAAGESRTDRLFFFIRFQSLR